MIPPTGQLVLGTATLGGSGAREDAFRLLDAFVDLGGTIIDTAAVYNDWIPGEVRRAEGIIGEWLRRGSQRNLFICTKGGHPLLERMDQSRLDSGLDQRGCRRQPWPAWRRAPRPLLFAP